MPRKFKINPRFMGTDFDICKKKTITIKDGVTVLIGCNGAGKTTMLHQLKHNLTKENIPVIMFNNLQDGGHNSVSSAAFHDDFSFVATAMCSSEGENIVMNLGKFAKRLGRFVSTGKDEKDISSLARAFASARGEEIEEIEIPKERWILLDAIDSGLSVDNIVDVKKYLFETIFKHNPEMQIYIVVSANEYEMARGEQCFDVIGGKYINLPDYEAYRQFILDSKAEKEKRYNQEGKES